MSRTPAHELIPVGQLQVEVQIPQELSPHPVRFLVAEKEATVSSVGDSVSFEVSSINDHEVCVVS